MKGLDLSEERYVRLYTRDSTAWALLSWEAQAVYPLLLRRLDRAGVLYTDGAEPWEAVAVQLQKFPEELIRAGVAQLIERGWLVHNAEAGALVDPLFMEADTAPRSDRARAVESRARRRDRAMSVDVTPKSRIVTPKSQFVVERDETVTPIRSPGPVPNPQEPPLTPPPGAGGQAEGGGRKREKREPAEIPRSLLTAIPDFAERWAERMAAAKSKPTPRGEARQLALLARWLPGCGAPAIIERVEAATAGSWQGIGNTAPPKPRAGSNGHHPAPHLDPGGWEAERARRATQPSSAPSVDIPARLRALADSLPDELPEVDAMRDRIIGLGRGDPDVEAVETALERFSREALRAIRDRMNDEEREALRKEIAVSIEAERRWLQNRGKNEEEIEAEIKAAKPDIVRTAVATCVHWPHFLSLHAIEV